MSRPGDWNCKSCQHLNFQRRDSCHRCGDPKMGDRGNDYGSFSARGGSSFGFSGSDVRPGDWYCSAANCGAHNFASRSSCFKCGAFKDESSGGSEGDMSRSRGRGAMNTTSLAGRNVSDAMHRGTPSSTPFKITSSMAFHFTWVQAAGPVGYSKVCLIPFSAPYAVTRIVQAFCAKAPKSPLG
ncbi:hypothetical protein HHK36_021488 [Tetracentron sinense]|uniref:RanBP2-type domain-containing protein n=1 Tax=Tetracentron sinense TaxID=13715 RepID=A0A834YBB4_TETSI|nr:hypothetical protein HHK36_031726 [Tetracentron sinense]KAF8393247.1 hypothetical protein HHK36_021488 [Tetracentron sinense]